jgi:tetrahydromethanopterin S-methyltransferase subunit E
MSDVVTPGERAHAALLKKAERGLRSRKLWMGVAGAVAPVALQLATGAVTWPVAVGAGVASVVAYLLGQSHVDGRTAEALGRAAGDATTRAASR